MTPSPAASADGPQAPLLDGLADRACRLEAEILGRCPRRVVARARAWRLWWGLRRRARSTCRSGGAPSSRLATALAELPRSRRRELSVTTRRPRVHSAKGISGHEPNAQGLGQPCLEQVLALLAALSRRLCEDPARLSDARDLLFGEIQDESSPAEPVRQVAASSRRDARQHRDPTRRALAPRREAVHHRAELAELGDGVGRQIVSRILLMMGEAALDIRTEPCDLPREGPELAQSRREPEQGTLRARVLVEHRSRPVPEPVIVQDGRRGGQLAGVALKLQEQRDRLRHHRAAT